jgi:hypothetical protein
VLYGAAVSRGSALLPQGVLASAADRAVQLVPTLLPTAAPASGEGSVSVGDLARAAAEKQLSADPRFRSLGPAEQARVLAQATESAISSLAGQLGVKATADSSVGKVTQGALTNILQGMQDKYGIYFTAAWLLGAFFIARSAAFLLTLALAFLVWLLVTILVSLGILKIEAVPSLHERITL